jgi:peptidyl-prolyl cis-trans isomerase B (cyclophilin B)
MSDDERHEGMAMTQSSGNPPPQWAPQYSQPPAGGYYPAYSQVPHTNSMAVASLICAFVMAPLGIVFGHVALSQIRRTGEEGRGFAIAGLAIGYVATALGILFIILWIMFFAAVTHEINNQFPTFQQPSFPSFPTMPTFEQPTTLPSFPR